MGMSVDIHVFTIDKLKANLEKVCKPKKGQMTATELLDKTMTTAGIVKDNLFIMQSCDYWDEYSPWSSMLQLFERYYQNSVYDVFSDARVAWRYDGAEVEDLAHEAGIEDLPRHPDDEDEDE